MIGLIRSLSFPRSVHADPIERTACSSDLLSGPRFYPGELLQALAPLQNSRLRDLVAVRMDVGTYNQDPTVYFDDVSISYTGYIASYNFEPAPEPTTVLLLSLGLLGLAARRQHAS